MGDKKNIDRLFQEKFKDFEIPPDDSLWSRIESELDAKNNKDRKAIPLWWKLGGVAAALALLFTIGYNSFKSDNSPNINTPITNVETEDPSDNGTRSIPNNRINSTDNDTFITEKEDGESIKKDENDSQELTVIESFVNNNDTNDKISNVNKSESHEKINHINPGQNNNTNPKTDAGTISGQTNGNSDQERSSVAHNTSMQQNDRTENLKTFSNNRDKEVKDPLNKDQIAEKDKLSLPDNAKERIAESEDKETLNDGNTNHERNSVAHTRSTRENDPTEDPETFNNNKDEETETLNDGKKSLIEVAEEQEKEKEMPVAKTDENRWSINPNVAPVYYNSIGSGSPIDAEFSDNSKSGDISMSYGINIAYQVNDKLSVRSGVNKVNYGYNTQGVEFTSSTQGEAMHNVNYSARSSNIKVSDNNSSSVDSSAEINAFVNVISASGVNVFEGAMNQNFAYLEVPLELKYRITDNKFGVNLIGGVSSLFLTDNQIILESRDLVTEMGEANNVNDVNFSTNIGIGFDYKFTKSLQFSVEPMFKYQLNAFSDDGGFKPYSLGIYTGLNFKF